MNRDLTLPGKLTRLRLIAITDAKIQDWPQIERAAAEAMGAGLPALMLREKTLCDADLLPVALRLRDQARRAGALFIVNRRLDLARELHADGIHLGAGGATLAEARRVLGPEALLGYSAHGIEEALAAFAAGANYVFLSPIFPTPSKAGILEPLGLAPLRELARRAPGSVIALGGISPENVGQVIGVGAHGAAVLRAILAAPNPEEATREMLKQINDAPLSTPPR